MGAIGVDPGFGATSKGNVVFYTAEGLKATGTRARAHAGENRRYSVTSPCLPRNQALQIRNAGVTFLRLPLQTKIERSFGVVEYCVRNGRWKNP